MELFKSDCGRYIIQPLSAATIPRALKLVGDVFCKEELVCIAVEMSINPNAIEEWLELYADAALDGVSVVAVEITSGDVVATCVNKLQVATKDSTEKTYFDTFLERYTHDSTKAALEFLTDVDGQCDFFEKYGVDCTLEMMALVTAPEHRQRKLGYLLFKASIDLAKKLKDGPVSVITLEDLGPKYAHLTPRPATTKVPRVCQSIGTSVGTQKIGKALNFTVLMRKPISEFVYKGKTYAERTGRVDLYCEAIALPLD